MPDVGSGIGAAGSIIGGIFGSKSSSKAADAQQQSAAASLALQKEMWEQNLARAEKQLGNIQPYYDIGTNALRDYYGKVSIGPGQFTESPGYQFRLGEGNKAYERSAAAKGNLLGGAQQKALSRYNQDFASNEYQNFLNQYYQSLAPYASLTSVGQNALGAQNQMLSSAMGVGTNYANAATGINQYSGNAAAQGYYNQANALSGGISNAANALMYGYGRQSGYGNQSTYDPTLGSYVSGSSQYFSH